MSFYRRLSDSHKQSKDLVKLPSLKDAVLGDREDLFIKKLRQCTVVYDFVFEPHSDIRSKEIKLNALIEVKEFLDDLDNEIIEKYYFEIIKMVAHNIFRTLSPRSSANTEEEIDDLESLNEPAWVHIQQVYEIFLILLEHPTFNLSWAKKYIEHKFIVRLLSLFESDDQRERDLLKTILHRIYSKLVGQRAFIRKQMNNVFYTCIYETEKHNGIAELLEILGSIINGFQKPLKDEHKQFLRKVLLPLHKVRNLSSFHSQLTYCVKEFIGKEPDLFKLVITDGLVKFWPRTHSMKEMMFLNEMEECLDYATPESFKNALLPLYTQLAKCISSQHFQVSERALVFLNNQTMQEYTSNNIKDVISIIFPALYRTKQHWSKTIPGLVFSTLKSIMEMNPKLFDEYTVKYKDVRAREKAEEMKRVSTWASLELSAKDNPLYLNYILTTSKHQETDVSSSDRQTLIVSHEEIRHLVESETAQKNPNQGVTHGVRKMSQ